MEETRQAELLKGTMDLNPQIFPAEGVSPGIR